MTALSDIRDRLLETHASLTKLRSELAESPDDDALALVITSVSKRQDSLERAFREAAAHRRDRTIVSEERTMDKDPDAYGRTGEKSECCVCHGSGFEYDETCVQCGGFGWVREETPSDYD